MTTAPTKRQPDENKSPSTPKHDTSNKRPPTKPEEKQQKPGVMVTAGNKPLGPKLPNSKRSGLPCGNCVRSGRPCWLHGGRSTGPKSDGGKRVVRQNAVKHGLSSDPARVRQDLEGERRARFEGLVRTIGEAEGVLQSPLDMELVRDIATTVLMTDEGREWMLRRGFVSVEGWRSIKLGDLLVNETDVDGKKIREPVVPEHFVDAMRALVTLKAKLHERLRAAKEGPARGTPDDPITFKLFGFDPTSYPPAGGT